MRCKMCRRPLHGANRGGYCQVCRRRRQCYICAEIRETVAGHGVCLACRLVIDKLHGLAGGNRPPKELREELLTDYEQRAALKLPLFGSAEKGRIAVLVLKRRRPAACSSEPGELTMTIDSRSNQLVLFLTCDQPGCGFSEEIVVNPGYYGPGIAEGHGWNYHNVMEAAGVPHWSCPLCGGAMTWQEHGPTWWDDEVFRKWWRKLCDRAREARARKEARELQASSA